MCHIFSSCFVSQLAKHMEKCNSKPEPLPEWKKKNKTLWYLVIHILILIFCFNRNFNPNTMWSQYRRYRGWPASNSFRRDLHDMRSRIWLPGWSILSKVFSCYLISGLFVPISFLSIQAYHGCRYFRLEPDNITWLLHDKFLGFPGHEEPCRCGRSFLLNHSTYHHFRLICWRYSLKIPSPILFRNSGREVND